jgi:hypothetical protein
MLFEIVGLWRQLTRHDEMVAQNEPAQIYCPWCGGPQRLSARGKEAANLHHERIRDTESRFRAGDLSVRGSAESDQLGHLPEGATRSEQAAAPRQVAPGLRRQKGNSPSQSPAARVE